MNISEYISFQFLNLYCSSYVTNMFFRTLIKQYTYQLLIFKACRPYFQFAGNLGTTLFTEVLKEMFL